MKKVLSLLLVCAMMVLTLASCNKASKDYANKVNEAAKSREYLTYETVMDDLGEDAVSFINPFVNSGWVLLVDDCDTAEDIKELLEKDKTVKGLRITITLGKATKAVYTKITKDDLKLPD